MLIITTLRSKSSSEYGKGILATVGETDCAGRGGGKREGAGKGEVFLH